MTSFEPKITRSHRRSPNARRKGAGGERFSLQGKRWRFRTDVTPSEIDARKSRLLELWRDHERFWASQILLDVKGLSRAEVIQLSTKIHRGAHKQGVERVRWAEKLRVCFAESEIVWSDLALWIADHIKLGVQPIELPPLELLLGSYRDRRVVDYRFAFLVAEVGDADLQRLSVHQLAWKPVLRLAKRLEEVYPSVSWKVPDFQAQQAAMFLEKAAVRDLSVASDLRGVAKPLEDQPMIPGMLHEALSAYVVKRRKDFTHRGRFDNSGHHMLSLVENFSKRQPDQSLSSLDFEGCQSLFDYWRNRPLNLKTGEPLSVKHCTSHIGELRRFLNWLHLTKEFDWKRPSDFDLVETKVVRLPTDRQSLKTLEVKTFDVEHLRLLYKHALLSERLNLVWCLNCSHGAAELGRVEWGDIYLDQPHPWAKDGLQIESAEMRNWCGQIRPKNGVVGWWYLWPETVALLAEWREALEGKLERQLLDTDRVVLTDKGKPLYRDSSRNAQTGFSNQWTRLRSRVNKIEGAGSVPKLPFGTLRDQLSNWLGSDQNEAVLASVGLAHGVPHKGDKLLYRHYANRPWAELFKAQQRFRESLSVVFYAS